MTGEICICSVVVTQLKNEAAIHHRYILPVLNADGYEYTWTHDRMWRKNRLGKTR